MIGILKRTRNGPKGGWVGKKNRGVHEGQPAAKNCENMMLKQTEPCPSDETGHITWCWLSAQGPRRGLCTGGIQTWSTHLGFLGRCWKITFYRQVTLAWAREATKVFSAYSLEGTDDLILWHRAAWLEGLRMRKENARKAVPQPTPDSERCLVKQVHSGPVLMFTVSGSEHFNQTIPRLTFS